LKQPLQFIFKSFKYKQGYSLLEVLMTIGLMSITALAMNSIIVNLSHQNKSITQKLEAVELEQTIVRLMADNNSCQCMFQGITWDNTKPVTLTSLKNGCNNDLVSVGSEVSSGKTGLKIKSINLKNLSEQTAIPPTADIFIEFEQSPDTMQLKPIKIASQGFTLTGSSIQNCLGVTNASAVCITLGGSIVSGTCVLSPNFACNSLGGSWSGSKCNFATVSPTTPTYSPPDTPSIPVTSTTAPMDCYNPGTWSDWSGNYSGVCSDFWSGGGCSDTGSDVCGHAYISYKKDCSQLTVSEYRYTCGRKK
jgi:prepilin-type N-terminal cleavage/methylation domain-containing protein